MKKFIGDVGVAAQGIVQPLELILTMYISVGLSGGLVSFVSPALGKGDYYTVQKYLMHYMIYLFLIMIIVPLFTLPFMGKIVISLGADEGTDMFKYAKQYGYVIISIGTVVYSINYGFGNILRATSRSLFNAIKQICTACIEFLMVYIFYTYVVQKGHVQTYTNAAAPIIANFITGCAVISLFIPFKRLNRTYKLKFQHKGWKPFDFLAMVEMLIIAIPDLLTQFQGPVVKIVGNKIIGKITKSYAQNKYQIAVLQMVANLSALVNTSNQSFGFAFGPSFGYALGMKNWNRVREIMKKTFYYQTGLNLILWIIMNGTVYCNDIRKTRKRRNHHQTSKNSRSHWRHEEMVEKIQIRTRQIQHSNTRHGSCRRTHTSRHSVKTNLQYLIKLQIILFKTRNLHYVSTSISHSLNFRLYQFGLQYRNCKFTRMIISFRAKPVSTSQYKYIILICFKGTYQLGSPTRYHIASNRDC
ncbi:Na+_driven multidrug efflux pump [Hexamita inflata]|uniref:Na+ driven multidrug efflux pump n=1 Tax=Hexamita inflata TaxID=28002 RepID=A0AA86NRX6_9EUKA|nr:Na+ driven multidrug efflux pump [Hexamita inflata]